MTKLCGAHVSYTPVEVTLLIFKRWGTSPYPGFYFCGKCEKYHAWAKARLWS